MLSSTESNSILTINIVTASTGPILRTEMSGQISQLRTAVDVLLRMSNLPPLSSYNLSSPTSLEQDISRTADDDASREDRDESLPLAQILTPLAAEDEGLWTNFFCYGILCPHDGLESLRKSSTALTAAICAVASLRDPKGSNNCKVCHTEFLKTISSSIFSMSHTADDIRALIVGAYWLGNVSYTLLEHAVQIAIRLNYYLYYFSVMKGPSQQDKVVYFRIVLANDAHFYC
ncbi:C6 transcription factor [Fusarium subglutinans]|uniref:C6 transcription factor n=1 Tax=Gibberella subglutinans TaxID=42677 RepID=A0A8H5KQC0_GIBSU|nr:C6 transcription factor [Fusarium subglutinans]KAF5578550.1 C6 transcription factor [Fusarium subglutinans]